VGPFSTGDGTFDSDMVDLAIVISTLSFGFKVCILTSSDCEYGTMGRKVFRLLWRFLDLWQRWRWWWIGFSFDLVGISIAWCRVCYLWLYGVVGCLWNCEG
jgi:hypothetical protein